MPLVFGAVGTTWSGVGVIVLIDGRSFPARVHDDAGCGTAGAVHLRFTRRA
ncbi:hypothetical protein OS128_01595 [Corynebacterium sp. P5848]|uniref:hypothetical protein n=1 Tax=Corynebacterium marambiense TaxID=2765364 RepID=UPI0022608FC8|nr:hypothetical protein [Corynebacterium marambiense]MCX7541616.1 hypothetical protein [Corynebacterium marambiense]